MDINRAFGEALKLARRAAHMSQEQLAEHMDMQQSALSRLERGVNSPSLERIAELAGALHTTPSVLLAKAEAILAFSETIAKGKKSAHATKPKPRTAR